MPPKETLEISLKEFIKNYVKPFKGKPNVLEVPFKELRKDGWRYNSRERKFTLAPKEADEG